MSKRLNDTSMSARSEVLPSALQVFDKFRQLQAVRKNNPEEVAERLNKYFSMCSESDLLPSVESMCLCLGISRQTACEWEKDVNSESGRLVRRAKDLVNSMITQGAMVGSINAIYTIWLQKNNAGYADSPQKIEVSQGSKDSGLAEKIESAGLVWSDSLQDFVIDSNKGGSD
jgi:hypothetical protein